MSRSERHQSRSTTMSKVVAIAGVLALALGSASMTSPAFAHQTRLHPTERVCSAPKRPGVMACLAIRRTDSLHQKVGPGILPSGYGPHDIQDAYGLASGNAAGRVVAIVDAYDDPTAASDLATYRSTYGLPACQAGCLTIVNQNGQQGNYPPADPGWASEISLDLDMVSAACPTCQILLVEANTASIADLGVAVNTAVAMGAKYVSNSYGAAEWNGETWWDSFYHHNGVVITASSGDQGYGVSYPAASPFVTAVGGTSLTPDGSARGWNENAWAGSGSGCSAYEPRPAYQNSNTGCLRRAVADVSAVANPQTGVAVYQTYSGSGWAVYGGTSVSAPIIASVYALAGVPLAGYSSAAYPYSHPFNLWDVTIGSNGTCPVFQWCHSDAFWDGPSGLGTPNGTTAFAAGPPQLAAAPPGGRAWVDFNGDGRADYCRRVGTVPNQSSYVQCTVSTGTGFGGTVTSGVLDWGYDAGRQWADVNGDGMADFCRADGNVNGQSSYAQCTVSTGTGFGQTVTSGVLDWGHATGRQWVDFNGDGKADYCRRIGSVNGQSSRVQCTLSTGYVLGQNITSSVLDWGYDAGRQWADVNGDGMADYCRVVGTTNGQDSRVSCTLSTGTGFGQTITSGVLDWGYPTGRQWIDFNGDGRADYCRRVGTSGQDPRVSCTLSTGTGFGQTVSSSILDWGYDAGRQWADGNGDGMADYCRVVGNVNGQSSYVQCMVSTGTGFGQTMASGVLDWGHATGRQWADFNADAKADYCRRVGSVNGQNSRVSCTLSTGTAFGQTVTSGVLDWGYDT